MKNLVSKILLTLLLILFLVNIAIAGERDSTSNYFSFPADKFGLCFGNSKYYNGLRINTVDADIRQINGINITLWQPKESDKGTINGVSFALIVPEAAKMNGIIVGGFGITGDRISGISIGTLGTVAQKLNGVSLSAGFIYASDINFVSVAGIGITGERIKGVSIGGIGVACKQLHGLGAGFTGILTDELRGIGIGGMGISAKEITGISMAGGLGVTANKISGLTISASYIYAREENFGLSISLLNITENLHGIQIGLYNYAGNNPKFLRRLPFINFHF